MATQRARTLILFAACLLGAVWWLFGFSVSREAGGKLRSQRFFGRIVRADADWKGDGTIDESFRYSWRRPMRHHEPPQIVLSDHDSNGRWDLWVEPGGEDKAGFPLATFRVDTDHDGQPDWTFVDHWQSQETYAKIKARRGY